jgi:FAD/FMN-containing dehydrogenase
MSNLTRRDFVRTGAAGSLSLWLPFRLQARSAAWHARAARAAIDPKALKELERRLKGRLLLPGSPGYEEASAPANGRYAGIKPLAVALCASEADVVTCVKWSREYDVRPVARGGAHSYAGFSTTRGLLINLSSLDKVAVDKRTGIAKIDGAALNENVFKATNNGNFFLPGGTCPLVGIGGLVLGGGIGFNTRWAGLTCDHLLASRIVTASGEVLEIDEQHHRDLFWACRGGAGGSFGINTSFTFQLVEVPRGDVTFFRITYEGKNAANYILHTFDQVQATAPPAFNADAHAQGIAASPNGAARLTVDFHGQYIGPSSDLHEIISPLLKVGKPTSKTYTTSSFWPIQPILMSEEVPAHSWGDWSRYSKAPLPQSVVEKVVNLVATSPRQSSDVIGPNFSFWSLGWVGGPVVDRIARTGTAYVHRNMLTLLRATPDWPNNANRAVSEDLLKWSKYTIDEIAGHTANESYQNFPNTEIQDWRQEYYAENYARLVGVKTRYDPGDVFNNAQSIPPRK